MTGAEHARNRGVIVDTSLRLQSVYVPVGDGVRLAVDVWLPVERTAPGGTVGTVMRVTRYHRAEAPQQPISKKMSTRSPVTCEDARCLTILSHGLSHRSVQILSRRAMTGRQCDAGNCWARFDQRPASTSRSAAARAVLTACLACARLTFPATTCSSRARRRAARCR